MASQTFDLIIRGGTVYDGSGGEPFVSVNGRLALQDGEHTGAFPGRALYGPGKK